MSMLLSTALALLKEKGFDPEDVNKACCVTGGGSPLWTPMHYFCAYGNLTMCRYLLSRGADFRARDQCGWYPMIWAAIRGHLVIMQWLYHDAGAHEDIRKLGNVVYSPLCSALRRDYFGMAKWLIRNGALAPRDDVNGGGIDDEIMRRDLREQEIQPWKHDKRLTVLSWARDTITAHDTVKLLLLTGTIVPTSLFRRHPNNPYATRSNKRRKKSSSPLVLLKGKAGILELIAHYVAGTPQQLRPLRQLNVLLPAFIEDTPFETTLQHTRT